jgi:hypothetical protein
MIEFQSEEHLKDDVAFNIIKFSMGRQPLAWFDSILFLLKVQLSHCRHVQQKHDHEN